jgi:hypothetical protein
MLEISLEVFNLLEGEPVKRFIKFLKLSLFVEFKIIQSVTQMLVLLQKTLNLMIVLSLSSQEFSLQIINLVVLLVDCVPEFSDLGFKQFVLLHSGSLCVINLGLSVTFNNCL